MGSYSAMSTRVYLLLELVDGSREKVAAALRGMPGISTIDLLEGTPDLLTIIEAPERQEAAGYLMEVLNLVDGVIEDVRVLPVYENTGNQRYTG